MPIRISLVLLVLSCGAAPQPAPRPAPPPVDLPVPPAKPEPSPEAAAHARARAVPLARSAAMGLRSAARLIGVNLLLSPLYLILLVTGVGTALAFFLVNAWLLGRDLGDMVAVRHLPHAELAAWRRQTGARRFAIGAIGTGLFLVPLLNLVAPVLGAAMATHAFHRGKQA
jgi:uncharacterized protein involved in cysteine biosynthesis